MSDASLPRPVNPWAALWFRPGAAIEAVIASRYRAASFLLWLVPQALALNALFRLGANLSGGARARDSLSLQLVFAPALVAGLLAYYYFSGWLLNGMGRLFGGRGTTGTTCAALGWSSSPVIVGDVLVLALEALAPGLKASPVGGLVVLGVQALAVLWSLALIVAMMARVQQFGKARAFLAYGLASVFVSILIAGIVRSFVYQPFNMPSGSMTPTLQVGDYFFANKMAYGYSRRSFPFDAIPFEGRILAQPPRRGDVAVFHFHESDWVKRIVGLPGEKIQLRHARLYIDGRLVERREVPTDAGLTDSQGKPMQAQTFEETLPGGAVHRIIQLQGDEGPASDTGVFEVPADSYFMLGDNRDNSMDSRFAEVGFVKSEDLVGRADVIFFSTDEDGDVRSERIATPIR